MKPRCKITLFLCAGLLFLASCLKDDPESKPTTIIYGYQNTPNINNFMPQELLEAFGGENLHFGESPDFGMFPPQLLDTVYADTMYIDEEIVDQEFYFEFINQYLGQAGMQYIKPIPEYYTETSSTEKTFEFLSKDTTRLHLVPTMPSFFSDSTTYTSDVFRQVYIMGYDSVFTAYYYEVLDTKEGYKPLNAVILSGVVIEEAPAFTDTTITGHPYIDPEGVETDSIINDTTINHHEATKAAIVGVRWGIETMTYLKPSDALTQQQENGELPLPGDIVIMTCDTLRPGKYHKPTNTGGGQQ